MSNSFITLLIESTVSEEVKVVAKDEVSKLVKFPGEALKSELESVIKTVAKQLAVWAKSSEGYAKAHGYKTRVQQSILNDPEKAAKLLVGKYVKAVENNPLKFKIEELLSGISLDLSK